MGPNGPPPPLCLRWEKSSHGVCLLMACSPTFYRGNFSCCCRPIGASHSIGLVGKMGCAVVVGSAMDHAVKMSVAADFSNLGGPLPSARRRRQDPVVYYLPQLVEGARRISLMLLPWSSNPMGFAVDWLLLVAVLLVAAVANRGNAVAAHSYCRICRPSPRHRICHGRGGRRRICHGRRWAAARRSSGKTPDAVAARLAVAGAAVARLAVRLPS
ncbi:hypothetical protein ACLOJK_026621 [Asimina triloba]